MGNRISDQSSSATGKVILSDGTIHEYEKPLTAAELMLEHPQQVVVEFRSAVSGGGKRPSPLPADEKLDLGKVYLMLPKRRGKPPALSPEEAQRLLSMANSVIISKPVFCSTTGIVPLFARLCRAGKREGGRFGMNRRGNLVERREEVRKVDEYLPEILEGLSPEFLSRQFSGGKGWKPSLDTIKEKVVEKKVSHWLFLNK